MSRTIFHILLAVLFMGYYLGNTTFIHTHTFADQKVTHSHPYLPNGHHTHSAAELQKIATLNLTLALLASVAALSFYKVYRDTNHLFHLRPVSLRNIVYQRTRAPAICI